MGALVKIHNQNHGLLDTAVVPLCLFAKDRLFAPTEELSYETKEVRIYSESHPIMNNYFQIIIKFTWYASSTLTVI